MEGPEKHVSLEEKDVDMAQRKVEELARMNTLREIQQPNISAIVKSG